MVWSVFFNFLLLCGGCAALCRPPLFFSRMMCKKIPGVGGVQRQKKKGRLGFHTRVVVFSSLPFPRLRAGARAPRSHLPLLHHLRCTSVLHHGQGRLYDAQGGAFFWWGLQMQTRRPAACLRRHRRVAAAATQTHTQSWRAWARARFLQEPKKRICRIARPRPPPPPPPRRVVGRVGVFELR